MSSNSDEKTDESQDPLVRLVTAVALEAAEAIDQIADVSDDTSAECFINAVRDINPGAICRRALLSIDDIERYVWSNCNELLSPDDELQNWVSIAHPHLRSGWLREQLVDEVMDVERCLRDLKDAAAKYGRSWNSNQGIGGIVSRALKGYANPLDGWMHLVGKGSSQTEHEQLVEDLADAFSESANALETVMEEISLKTRLKLSAIKTEYFSY